MSEARKEKKNDETNEYADSTNSCRRPFTIKQVLLIFALSYIILKKPGIHLLYQDIVIVDKNGNKCILQVTSSQNIERWTIIAQQAVLIIGFNQFSYSNIGNQYI